MVFLSAQNVIKRVLVEPLAHAGYCSGYIVNGNVGEGACVLLYEVVDTVVLGC